MEIKKMAGACPLARGFLMGGILKRFKGVANVEVHILRPNAAESELLGLEELARAKSLTLVAPPHPGLPAAARANFRRENALGYILEAFTEEECNALVRYLETRWGERFANLVISPLDLPVPFEIAPLARMPESAASGFIRFEKDGAYPFDFPAWGYYELGSQASASRL